LSTKDDASILGSAHEFLAESLRNLRDGMSEILPGNHSRRGIDVKFIDHQIVIDLYVIIQHGTRISEVAHGIMNRVKFTVERALSMSVSQVNVHVQGLHLDEKS